MAARRFKPVVDPIELALIAVGVAVVAFAAGVRWGGRTPPAGASPWPVVTDSLRRTLAEELQPVTLQNCDLKRYGSRFGGGYLMCANLTAGVTSAYSYGIDQEDNWGCDVSRELGVPIHQYDCFTEARPSCPGGRFVFHDECVGPRRETIDGRLFDSVPAQIAANGDGGQPLLFKMDIEGAEWDSLAATPDDVLDTFVQIPMEFHLRLADEATFLAVVRRLKARFYLVNLHFNNNALACFHDGEPLASRAFQALWVNKRVGILDPAAPSPAPPSPLNAIDDPYVPDCQPVR